jgi:hypothetical protein
MVLAGPDAIAVPARLPARPALAPVVTLVAVLAVTLCGCATSSRHGAARNRTFGAQSSPPVAPTLVTRFSPYSAAGGLTVPVAGRTTGRCWTGSIEVPVARVYRCLVGNDIADPCFAPPRQSSPPTVACVPAPWARAQVVTLSEPLPGPEVIGKSANPWAVQLANGVRCLAAAGTVHTVGGVSLNLLCLDGTAAGGLDSSHPNWRVKYGSPAGGSLTPIDVSRAWRG